MPSNKGGTAKLLKRLPVLESSYELWVGHALRYPT